MEAEKERKTDRERKSRATREEGGWQQGGG